QPNFVIIIGDDCSYSDLNIYGGPNTKTPNLHTLAKEGMMFNQCFQAAPMSSPTRHCLYTGVYPVRSGAYPNHTFVKDDIKSFVQYFQPVGYRTALYGKQHVAPKKVFSYDYLGDYPDGNMNFSIIKDYITKDSSKPFFMVVASHESHGPFTVGDPTQWDPEKIVLPPHLVDTKATRQEFVKYLAEIEVLDEEVGKVMQTLKDAGVYDNTVLLFLSEQGNSFPFAKWTCYNQGLHSGMIVRYPKKVKAGAVSNALVEYVDVLPTFLDIAGIKVKKGQLDGKSFYPVLQQKTDEHKTYVFGLQTTRGIIGGSEYFGIRSAATKRYRYIRNLTPKATFKNVATGKKDPTWQSWLQLAPTDKFAAQRVHDYQIRPAEELYDLQNDPYEFNNQIDNPEYAAIKKELSAAMDKWMLQQGDKGQETELKANERKARNMSE
ncbi:MAG: sulfatase, partial [Paludibacter sp.]|nr:sulfatase [Paludibacter sp.]